MSQLAQVKIVQVFEPEGTRPYNVLTDGDPGRLATFKAELGEKVKEYVGKSGTLQFDVQTKEKNGETYTNYIYEGFQPSEDIQTLDSELTQRTNGSGPNYRQPTHPQEQASIQRAVALQQAVAFLPYIPEGERTVGGVLAIAKQLEENWLKGT